MESIQFFLVIFLYDRNVLLKQFTLLNTQALWKKIRVRMKNMFFQWLVAAQEFPYLTAFI
jgi:hypothetical protein